ncbi:DUF2931 family protein [Neisseria sp. Ec49-e6-T10]|uniref:DUF2931 family protein n=1 Tax=Neisseria sp. Ec49-e6-T10 TaxID=3140744 RepID=UPI003EBC45FC
MKKIQLIVLAVHLLVVPLICSADMIQEKDKKDPVYFSVIIEPPGTAGLIIERTQSYFMDKQGKPLLYFGGWDGTGNIDSTENIKTIPISNINMIPDALKIRWFSVEKNQFWEGDFTLPKEKISNLINPKEPEDQNFRLRKMPHYSSFLVTIKPKGQVVLWLVSEKQQVQVSPHWSANKTNMKWSKFVSSLPEVSQHKNRKRLVQEMKQKNELPYLDEMFVLSAFDKPTVDFEYVIEREDGVIYRGTTDKDGETRRINTGQMPYSLNLYDAQTYSR